jgi:hypothetical protein
MREEIRQKRNKIIMDQMTAKINFFENLKTYGLSAIIIAAGGGVLWWLITLVIAMEQTAGKW